MKLLTFLEKEILAEMADFTENRIFGIKKVINFPPKLTFFGSLDSELYFPQFSRMGPFFIVEEFFPRGRVVLSDKIFAQSLVSSLFQKIV